MIHLLLIFLSYKYIAKFKVYAILYLATIIELITQKTKKFYKIIFKHKAL